MSLAAQCVAVLLQSFSYSWRMFCIMFLFVGASQISIYISAFVLGTLFLVIFNVLRNYYFINYFQFYPCFWLLMVSISLSLSLSCPVLNRNRAAKQDHASGLHSSRCFSFLLHWLHDLTLDCIWYQRMEDPPCSSVHDVSHLHPPVVVCCLTLCSALKIQLFFGWL